MRYNRATSGIHLLVITLATSTYACSLGSVNQDRPFDNQDHLTSAAGSLGSYDFPVFLLKPADDEGHHTCVQIEDCITFFVNGSNIESEPLLSAHRPTSNHQRFICNKDARTCINLLSGNTDLTQLQSVNHSPYTTVAQVI